MKKIHCFLFIFIMIPLLGIAQEDDPTFWKKLKYGGGFGFGFGNHQTTLAISPSAIYPISQRLHTGIVTSYLYSKQYDLKSNVYGISALSLYHPFEQLQLSAEFGQLFITQKLGIDKTKYDYPVLNLGVAYRIGFFSTGLQFDVLYNEDTSIFASPISPIIRFYF
ncbi:hypothetical protein MWU59_09830 [Flavobacteriaceae bacterium F08102]|nr:hypothetical protein [Flavobacteriaceae bacterium F08102]